MNQGISPILEYSAINQSKNGYDSSESPMRVESNANRNYASDNGMNNKVAMITFGDGWKSRKASRLSPHYLYAVNQKSSSNSHLDCRQASLHVPAQYICSSV